MNTKQIDYILELADVGNFNRAAENLFISQPTLTYQIKLIEEEIGFALFERSPKGAVLTPAGEQFCVTLRNIRAELKRAIEQGQNFSTRWHKNITIGLPMRSAIYFLPEAVRIFESEHNGIFITPHFLPLSDISSFMRREEDIVFAMMSDVKHVSGITIHELFESRIYLITDKADPLAQKELITAEDLKGRMLMVGGGSPPELRAVQQRVIGTVKVQSFNSNDHDTTLTNILSGKGICLAPGFLNDHSGGFAWIPFDCQERVKCVLCTRSGENREEVKEFVRLLHEMYMEKTEKGFMI